MADLMDHARRELRRSKESSDPMEAWLARRQAAEKAWGYVVEQTSRATGIKVTGPGAHAVRKDALALIDRRAGTSLLRDYIEFEYRLHGDAFYDGRGSTEEIERHMARAAEFPDRVRKAVRRVRR